MCLDLEQGYYQMGLPDDRENTADKTGIISV
jgi:hypothetical protein